MNPITRLKRQLRRLQQARQLWRQRNADKQRHIRKLRVAVRDLTASRDLWKQRVRSRDGQPQDLEAPPLTSLPLPLTAGLPAEPGLGEA